MDSSIKTPEQIKIDYWKQRMLEMIVAQARMFNEVLLKVSANANHVNLEGNEINDSIDEIGHSIIKLVKNIKEAKVRTIIIPEG